ncbi:Molybdopterin synthase catalytic subunit MoaE [Pseudomonas chlororaphis subsp. aureofaciens]|uniref:molybdopterin synthase catalytic subunit MoaE n=1 Tax=Pseudomonas chlororaphis TaxID=587753 RepID=UPI000F55E357|nr:molybdopterin synthase catalytic subunit MoaE [Pseudomonas chlororaphis]AZE12180.1 Molybdopterin synthase catalytic subunit MoaE [Pseudomonas chlororaphis subsp. aureofaciens]
MTVHVQAEALGLDRLHHEVHGGDPSIGAVVTFVGYVRDLNLGEQVGSLFLEHYPGMTERALQRIVDEANERWPLQRVRVVHRVGVLQVAEPIVFVGVASAHRQAAFAACAFLMDYLKTRAPFWKREQTSSGERWVEGRESDQLAASRW